MADGANIGEEHELMLELSMGGIFGNPRKPNGDLNLQPNGVRRRKREEGMKKLADSGSCGSVSGPFVENNEWLEAQVVRRKDEPVFKKEKIGNISEKIGLVSACRSFRPYQGNVNSNGGASSAYSDGQCSSHQGGGTDDTRSNSSNSQLDQQPATTSTASVEPFGSSKPNNQSKPHESRIIRNPPSKPEPNNSQHQLQASLLAQMPCVSTTGNGPDGKTISGFLHRYTKNEVTIMCVCHGRSFSPAGFVEHAGGVDIVHPLKHITIFPAAFAS